MFVVNAVMSVATFALLVGASAPSIGDLRNMVVMPRSAGRRTQEQRRAETERRVIDAAMELIAQRGSRAVTLAEVGEAAGYSRGIVHHHFGNRAGLLDAVMRDAQRFDVPSYDGNALEQLVGMTEAYLLNIADRAPSSRAFLQLWGEAIAVDPVLTPLFEQRDADFRAVMADRIRAGIADGSMRRDIDPASAAVLLVGLLRGCGLQLVATPPVSDVPGLIVEAKRSVAGAFRPTSAGAEAVDT
jgi:AcrR family transcriptional regulator